MAKLETVQPRIKSVVRKPKKRRTPLTRRVKWWFQRAYWSGVNRINRRAYLGHLLAHAEDFSDYFEEYDEFMFLETHHWMERGRKVHVSVSDVGPADGDESYWKQGISGQYIRWSYLHKLKPKIEAAEDIRRKRGYDFGEHWLKWLTAIASTVAAIASTGIVLHWWK